MIIDVAFQENNCTFDPNFGEVHNVSDGGYERGYAAGYEVGNTDGYTKGHTEGVEQGYADGYNDGEADGFDNFVGERAFVLTGTATTVPDWGFQNINCAFEIDLPYVTELKGGSFYGCKKLTKANLPLVTTNNASTFYGCTALTDINLPILPSVGSYTFRDCTSLEMVDFPLAKDIWSYAFTGCTNLRKLVLRFPTGCSLRDVNALTNTPIESGTGFVYVPDNLVEQYKAATNWSTYASQIKPISELPE